MQYTDIEKLEKEKIEESKKQQLSNVLEQIYVSYRNVNLNKISPLEILNIIKDLYTEIYRSSFESDFKKLYNKCLKLKNAVHILYEIEQYISE